MNIDHISTMTRIGRVIRRPDHDRKLAFDTDEFVTREQLTDNRGRVYAIVIDGVIEKLGGSQAKGGIKATFEAYFGGFAYGMSARTYCVWNYLTQAIDAGKVVEVYCVWAPEVTQEIPTMTGSEVKLTTVDYHDIESAFVKEYVELEGKYPELNMQESGRRWEDTGLLEGWPGMAKRFEPAV